MIAVSIQVIGLIVVMSVKQHVLENLGVELLKFTIISIADFD